jgi:hypothetical protein
MFAYARSVSVHFNTSATVSPGLYTSYFSLCSDRKISLEFIPADSFKGNAATGRIPSFHAFCDKVSKEVSVFLFVTVVAKEGLVNYTMEQVFSLSFC